MMKGILTAVGLVKAPKATILLRHPLKGTAALLAWRGIKNADGKAKAIVAGAMAGAVALPMAAWLLRR
jgi:hypothetical protein